MYVVSATVGQTFTQQNQTVLIFTRKDYKVLTSTLITVNALINMDFNWSQAILETLWYNTKKCCIPVTRHKFISSFCSLIGSELQVVEADLSAKIVKISTQQKFPATQYKFYCFL